MKPYRWLLLSILLISISGCTNKVTDGSKLEPVHVSTSIPTRTLQPSLRVLPTSSLIATPTFLITQGELLPTNTIVPTKLPTLTPLPTLKKDDAERSIKELFTANSKCRLPCFNGFTPGKSSWSEVKNALLSISDDYSPGYPGVFLFKLPTEFGQGEKQPIYIYKKDNQDVELIQAAWFDYPIPKLLADYGRPSEIYIFVLPLSFSPPGLVELVFYYPDYGFTALYAGITGVGHKLSICPGHLDKMDDNPKLWVWNLQTPKTFKDITLSYEIGIRDLQEYRPILQATGLGVDEFYKIYCDVDSNIQCFEMDNPYSPY